jgi:hypothetical protein
MEFAGASGGSRFGKGLYSTATSSKAFLYMKGKPCMFMVKVACGRAHIGTDQGDIPSDKHCRIANAEADECIVFKDEAILPTWLLILDSTGKSDSESLCSIM